MIGKLLVIGHGSMGQRHERLAREALLHASVRVLPARGGRAPGQFADLGEALAWGPDAAIVASPAPFHADAAAQLLDAGAAVLVEKPLAHTLEDASRIAGDARRTGGVLAVAYPLRHHPVLNALHGQVPALAPLHLQASVGQNLATWRPGRAIAETVSADASLGGGALLELSHEVDLANWFLGPVSQVRAQLSSSGTWGDVEDVVDILAVHPRGRSLLHMDMIDHDAHRSLRLVGPDGTLSWDGGHGDWSETTVAGATVHSHPEPLRDRDDMYRRQFSAFLAFVDGRGPGTLCTADEGVAVLQVVEAARQAALESGVSA